MSLVWRDQVEQAPMPSGYLPTPSALLAMTAGDVVAIVSQSLEASGDQVELTPRTRLVAEDAAAQLLAALTGSAPAPGGGHAR